MSTIAAILPYIQIVTAILLVALVLLQQSDADLGGTFGGSDNMSAAHTRRGLERIIFNLSIAAAVLFAASTLAALIIR